MRRLPRYTGEASDLPPRRANPREPGAAILTRDTTEDPWLLQIWLGEKWKRIPMAGACVCHPTTGPCDAAVNDTAARIVRGDHPDIYTPEKR